MRKLIAAVAAFVCVGFSVAEGAANILYVKPDGTGSGAS